MMEKKRSSRKIFEIVLISLNIICGLLFFLLIAGSMSFVPLGATFAYIIFASKIPSKSPKLKKYFYYAVLPLTIICSSIAAFMPKHYVGVIGYIIFLGVPVFTCILNAYFLHSLPQSQKEKKVDKVISQNIIIEKKWIIGTTLVAWIFIIEGLLSALSIITGWKYAISLSPSAAKGIFDILIVVLLSLGGMVGGLQVLKRISWGRKLLTFVAAYHIIGSVLMLSSVMNKGFYLLKGLGIITASPTESLSPYESQVLDITWISQFILFVILCYFLTRPKVKEQFR